tara:strand:- start:3822 stop:4994 length:1173 start_codon:yes stop_codon:yes gene_type:complete
MSQSSLNSFNGVLASGASFTGKKEVINGSISIVCFLESTQNIEIQIFQSKDGVTFINTDIIVVDTLLSGPQTRTQFYTKLQWGYVKITNISGLSSTVLLSTLFTPNNHDGTPTQPTYVNIVNSSLAPIPVSGSVDVNNLITETLATRGVYYLIVGNWYRVATIGITTGAEWNAIGAIIDGESIPVIGRLFQCLAIGTNVAGQGTCYDVEYNTNSIVSGSVSVSNFPAVQTVDGTVKITDTFGGTIATTAGNLMIGIGNIYTANPLHTIVDSGTISLSNSLNTATYNSGAIVAGGYTSPSFDLNENSLFDCLLFATGVIVAGNLRLDYSVDNINWMPNNTTSALATINSTDPHFVYLGIKSGSRYVRISTSVGSTFTTNTNLQIIFSSKRN